jgi:hypothetical protein
MAAVQQQLEHPEHAVQRRADLVAHVGQELRLGAGRGERLVARDRELGLDALVLGDVVPHRQHAAVERCRIDAERPPLGRRVLVGSHLAGQRSAHHRLDGGERPRREELPQGLAAHRLVRAPVIVIGEAVDGDDAQVAVVQRDHRARQVAQDQPPLRLRALALGCRGALRRDLDAHDHGAGDRAAAVAHGAEAQLVAAPVGVLEQLLRERALERALEQRQVMAPAEPREQVLERPAGLRREVPAGLAEQVAVERLHAQLAIAHEHGGVGQRAHQIAVAGLALAQRAPVPPAPQRVADRARQRRAGERVLGQEVRHAGRLGRAIQRGIGRSGQQHDDDVRVAREQAPRGVEAVAVAEVVVEQHDLGRRRGDDAHQLADRAGLLQLERGQAV